jgi:hypothetical protein
LTANLALADDPSRMKSLLALLVAVSLLGGCGIGRTDHLIVDGLSVGAPAGCGMCIEPQSGANCGTCESLAILARRAIGEKWPDHPPIVSLLFYGEGSYPGPNGEEILQTRSGSLLVGLATFADGTRHAVGVYCGVGGCRATVD